MGCGVSKKNKAPGPAEVANRKAVHQPLTTKQKKRLEKKPHLWSDPSVYTMHLTDVWEHYAKKPKMNKIDKAGLQHLASDVLRNFRFRVAFVAEKVKSNADAAFFHSFEDNNSDVQPLVVKLMDKYLPFDNHDNRLLVTRWYLGKGLAFKKGKGVTKSSFCVNFPGLHNALFASPPANNKISIEREQVIEAVLKEYNSYNLGSVRRKNQRLIASKRVKGDKHGHGADKKDKKHSSGNKKDLKNLSEADFLAVLTHDRPDMSPSGKGGSDTSKPSSRRSSLEVSGDSGKMSIHSIAMASQSTRSARKKLKKKKKKKKKKDEDHYDHVTSMLNLGRRASLDMNKIKRSSLSNSHGSRRSSLGVSSNNSVTFEDNSKPSSIAVLSSRRAARIAAIEKTEAESKTV